MLPLPKSDAGPFQDITDTQQDLFPKEKRDAQSYYVCKILDSLRTGILFWRLLPICYQLTVWLSQAITFEMQKNDRKFDTVIHGHTDDTVLCPVLQWARLVNRILSYPNTTCNTPVCAVWRHGRLDKITSTQVLSALRAASNAVGSARLGFEPSEMGTHSLCSGAAMEMYLAGVPVYTIMLIGRWLSDAFLRYIRKQMEQFSRHVAKQMLTFWSF